jgi:hypothetical protein
MKAKLHFPTESFGFTEVEVEVKDIEEALDLYNTHRSPNLPPDESLGGSVGLEPKEWRSVLDEYLTTGRVLDGVNIYERMSPSQKSVVQEIKKAFKRIKNEN